MCATNLLPRRFHGEWVENNPFFLQRVKPACWILATGLLWPTKLVDQQMWAEFCDTILPEFACVFSLHECAPVFENVFASLF